MKGLDSKLKRKIGVLVVLGILATSALAIPVTSDLQDTDWHRDDAEGEVYVYRTTDRAGIGDDDPDFKLEVAVTSGGGYLGVSSAAGNDGDVFIIDSSGNVGIGVTDPQAALVISNGQHLMFDFGRDAMISVQTSGTIDRDGYDLAIVPGHGFSTGGPSNNGGNLFLGGGQGYGSGTGGNGGDVYVFGGEKAVNGVDGNVILACVPITGDQGKVGIGTTSPSASLDVGGGNPSALMGHAGDVLIADDLEIDDDVRIDGNQITTSQAIAWDLYSSSIEALNIESGLLKLDTVNTKVGVAELEVGDGDASGLMGDAGDALIADDLEVDGDVRIDGLEITTSQAIDWTLPSSTSALHFGLSSGPGLLHLDTASGIGRVGIRTETPDALLDIGDGTRDHVDGDNDVLIADDIEIDGDVFIDGTTITTSSQAINWYIKDTVRPSLSFDYATLSIDALNNRVGIGTLYPDAALDIGDGTMDHMDGTNDVLIAGDIEIDGNVYIDGGTIDTTSIATNWDLKPSDTSSLAIDTDLMRFDTVNSRVGIGSMLTISAKLHSHSNSEEQLRLSHSGNFASFEVDSNGVLNIKPSSSTYQGKIKFQPEDADSSAFFQIYDKDIPNIIFNVDTSNDRVSIGSTNLGVASLNSWSTAESQLSLFYDTGDYTKFHVDSTGVLNINPGAGSGGGKIKFQPLDSDSTTFFQIYDIEGTDDIIFNVDTSNNRVGIGTATPDTAIHINGAITLNERSSNPTSPDSDGETRVYIKSDKFIVQYMDGETVKYRYMDLTSTDANWSYSESSP